ncbi:MAG: nucleotide sugar dehydrogenase [Chloracidobacterium sp.]|uniref:Nucleotide sugar dehydrogenase n=1 Tax=Chloracidobacterium validum TaxID=2821543 RepID=A0ABX8BDZ8_9BACT|nr:nucleotide sugar dehydrogenase [Chloracidobacterium validum]QUW04622.1 nucleotide sugar dehydrogenase [Chloracidobacterium validum]
MPHHIDYPTVGIIGLGYVGLPLAVQFIRGGCQVIGFDIDEHKVSAINAGRAYIKSVPAAVIAEAAATRRLTATTDSTLLASADAIVICVPTPLTAHREPDLSFITRTAETLAPRLRRGQLVSLESTTYPGTTEEELIPRLERGSGLRAGLDFHVVYSPEREDPGNPNFGTRDIPKVIGGLTADCLAAGVALYQHAVQTLVPVSSLRVAEATKLVENIFRCVNIAMVNELKIVFDAMGLDVWEVLDAAKTKPFGFMKFEPGPGLGGHCIPIDPFYLTWKAREFGVQTKFIELAGDINTSMPRYVVTRLLEALSDAGKPLRGANILLLGLAYKKNVDDPRESPTFAIWDLLRARQAQVLFHDPHIPVAPPMREYPAYAGTPSVPLTAEVLAQSDAVVICTAHDSIDYAFVVQHAPLVIDTRNVCAGLPAELVSDKVTKA